MSTSFENTLSIAGVELHHLRREELDACDGHRMETVAAVGTAGVQDEGVFTTFGDADPAFALVGHVVFHIVGLEIFRQIEWVLFAYDAAQGAPELTLMRRAGGGDQIHAPPWAALLYGGPESGCAGLVCDA